jgi:hypothetical protein
MKYLIKNSMILKNKSYDSTWFKFWDLGWINNLTNL